MVSIGKSTTKKPQLRGLFNLLNYQLLLSSIGGDVGKVFPAPPGAKPETLFRAELGFSCFALYFCTKDIWAWDNFSADQFSAWACLVNANDSFLNSGLAVTDCWTCCV